MSDINDKCLILLSFIYYIFLLEGQDSRARGEEPDSLIADEVSDDRACGPSDRAKRILSTDC